MDKLVDVAELNIPEGTPAGGYSFIGKGKQTFSVFVEEENTVDKDKLILRLKGSKRCQQIAANRFAMQGRAFSDIVNVCLYHQYVGQLSLQTAVENIYSDMADEIIEKRKG